MNTILSFLFPKGRLTRSEFWKFLFVTFLIFVFVTILYIKHPENFSLPIMISVAILSLLIFFSYCYHVSARLHDIGKSSTEYFLYCAVSGLQSASWALLLWNYMQIPNFSSEVTSTLTNATYILFTPSYLIGIWFLFNLLCRDSQPGINRYGESKKYPGITKEFLDYLFGQDSQPDTNHHGESEGYLRIAPTKNSITIKFAYSLLITITIAIFSVAHTWDVIHRMQTSAPASEAMALATTLINIPFFLISVWFLFNLLHENSQCDTYHYNELKKHPGIDICPSKTSLSSKSLYIILCATIIAQFSASCLITPLCTLSSALITLALLLFLSHQQGTSPFKIACLFLLGYYSILLCNTSLSYLHSFTDLEFEQCFSYLRGFGFIRHLILIIAAFLCIRNYKARQYHTENLLHNDIKQLIIISILYVINLCVSAYAYANTTSLSIKSHQTSTESHDYITEYAIDYIFSPVDTIINTLLYFYIFISIYKLLNKKIYSAQLAIPISIFCSATISYASGILKGMMYCYSQTSEYINHEYHFSITMYAILTSFTYALTISCFVFTPKAIVSTSLHHISVTKARIIYLILILLTIAGWMYKFMSTPYN